MADAKWISDLASTMAFSTAARRVLEVRLGAVAERLPLALLHADEDREHVHQLRVSTRRAGAAARIFGECIGSSEERVIKKSLKRIRRAAGAARDWDVFQEMIAAKMVRATVPHKPAYDFLLGYGQGQRALAQTHLDSLARLAEGKYTSAVAKALAALDKTPILDSFRSHAVPRLTTLLHELDAAAARDLEDYENLHQVRILGKQLRYAMEIFASCFDSDFREAIYPAVEEMQEILGHANDSAVAIQRLQEIRLRLEMTQPKEWSRFRAGILSLQRSHLRKLPQQRTLFMKWWQAWQATGMEKRFEQMLLSS